MNKYLMLLAAGLMAEASPAIAAQDGHHASIVLSGSMCSQWSINWTKNTYLADIVGYSCVDTVAHKIGIAGKTKGVGKNANFDYPPPLSGWTAISVDLQVPIKNFNNWTMYGELSGVVYTIAYGQYQTYNNANRNYVRPTSGKLKELLQRRAAEIRHQKAQP